jgi:hypothetical protein
MFLNGNTALELRYLQRVYKHRHLIELNVTTGL